MNLKEVTSVLPVFSFKSAGYTAKAMGEYKVLPQGAMGAAKHL